MVHVYLLPADEGDFIWVRYGRDGNYANILIDGGTKDSGPEYAEIMERIEGYGETIEALVLTHIDFDHIQGAVEGIGKVPEDILKRVVKRVLFNTCKGISRRLGQAEGGGYAEDRIKANIFKGGYGMEDAVSFMDLLEKKGISDRVTDYIVSGTEMVWDKGAKVKIISPGEKELEAFLKKWEPYCAARGNSSYAANLEMTREDLGKLSKARLGSDPSVNNGASLAFLFEYGDVRIAFLGDARPSACMRGLKALNIKLPYKADMLKLSHHGSRNNTSDLLLKNIKTETYMLSTNGKGQKVPNKATLAHLLKNAEGYDVKLLCNYDWWETAYQGKYFTEDDRKTYLDTGRLEALLLSEDAWEVKDGLNIYGEW